MFAFRMRSELHRNKMGNCCLDNNIARDTHAMGVIDGSKIKYVGNQ